MSAKRHPGEGFQKLSEEAGILRSRVRFLGWALEDPEIEKAASLLERASETFLPRG